MLSRVADALYWTSRYLERAESVTRLLHVNFHRLLDARIEDPRAVWEEVLRATGDEALFRTQFEEFTARNTTEFLLWHPANPNAVASCIVRARENARRVREQISSEMWAELNKLWLLVESTNRVQALSGPHDFFLRVRQASHAFQGATVSTMSHGEAFEFVQLGAHFERASLTVRILGAKEALVGADASSSPAWGELIALLKSCSAFEAYSKLHGEVGTRQVLQYLLLDRAFPRSVLFSLDRCLAAVTHVGGAGPARTLGHLSADLQYSDVPEPHSELLRGFLHRLLLRIDRAAGDVEAAYFNTHAIVAATAAQAQQ